MAEHIESIVLDTSVFTNPDTAQTFGETRGEAFETFIELAERARPRLRFLMPPLIYDELRAFLSDEGPPPSFELVVSLRSPDRHGVRVPGYLIYELIEDLRDRIDKGLRVAEKHARDAHPERIDEVISKLRHEYRSALRAGLLDSREEVDLILLAREIDGALVSSDRGVRRWAERVGVRLIDPARLRGILDAVVSR